MQTFTPARPMVPRPGFAAAKRRALAKLDPDDLDAPVRGLVADLNRLPFCFTLQCCWGHFLYKGQTDPFNLHPLPDTPGIGPVEYKIAYLALCLDHGPEGAGLLAELAKIPDTAPGYIQFGCAEWFWRRQVNSYVLQVMPERAQGLDQDTLSFAEAKETQKARDGFFARLQELVAALAP